MPDADDDDNTSIRGGGDADFDIDLKAIHDEIVEAVIVQLQHTQNRPHIVKDLAAVLMKQLKIVEKYSPSLPFSCTD